MTDTEAALLRAIAAMPDEDTPRLVFADYLDEKGEPAASARAEFIRLQVRAVRFAHDDPERAAVLQRTDELLAAWDVAWQQEVPTGFQALSGYHRGFACRAAALASAVVGVDDDPRALFVRQLELNVDASAARLREAVRQPLFAQIEELNVRGAPPMGWSGAKAFSEGEYPNLERLSLAGQALGDIGLRYLCNSWGLSRLRELDLSNNGITDDGAGTLLRSGLLHRLQRLTLWGNDIGHATTERLRANGRVW